MSKVDLRLQCGMPCSKLEVSTAQHGTLSGAGYLHQSRWGYEIDTETVLAACAEHGVAVEINANPRRLDLDWRWHDIALKLGCLMSINPDAHSTRELDLTHWGVEMARKGGVPKERVLNCLGRDELAFYLEKRRDRRVKLVSLQDRKPRLRTPTSGVKKPAAPHKRLKATDH